MANVLLIDDEPLVRKVGLDMLEALGHTAVAAADGREGIDLFSSRSDEFDAVIIDLILPDMEGEEVFKEVRRINPAVQVILSSGYPAGEDVQQLLDEGNAAFVQKPYRLADLSQALESRVEN